MLQKVYKEIAEHINNSTLGKNLCVLNLHAKYPLFSEDTFISIFSQIWQRKIKRDFHKLHRKDKIIKLLQRYNFHFSRNGSEGFINTLAFELDFPPTLVARIFIEGYLKEQTDIDTDTTVLKSKISHYLKEPKDIKDATLSREVEICVENDELCGPHIEKMKRECGIKYENVLHNFLVQNDIAYYHEDELRKEGYDKTPDFKLVVPVIVNNHVIHWIESKALFGDEESHSMYLEKQFWSYTNRFGPGLVIYWFGFIDELDVNLERGVMLSDSFPEEIITLDQLLDEQHQHFSIEL